MHVPVKAIGKKSSTVFPFPKCSLKLICFGPSAVLVGRVKSGALVPMASAMLCTIGLFNHAIANRKSEMELLWWFAAIVVMAIGLIGTVLPVVPGTTIILAAAVLHRVMVGPEKGMSWWALAGLVALTLVSYALDFASSYFGAKYFGATKWGVVGAVIGGIVGVFTGFVTLLVLPIVGAIAGELIAGKQLVKAGKAGWGALLGNLAGMIGKLAIGLVMVVVFLLNAGSPGV